MTGLARGKVFRLGNTWYLEIFDSFGRLVNRDNTGAWRPMYESALCRVHEVRSVERMGHRLQRWTHLTGQPERIN